MAKINYNKYQRHVDFINEYSGAGNAATKSKYDSNANIENKNVATLSCEMHKEDDIGTNRLRMIQKLTELYDEEFAQGYIQRLDSHIIYRHDETHPLFPYCVSVTLYPFICKGLKSIGGPSDAPSHISSFAGNFVNLVFAISAQFAGAVATPEYLSYLDYFIRQEYGDDYYLHADDTTNTRSKRSKTIAREITDVFEQIAHSLNEPAAARNYQSVFWNIAYFDKPYFDALFEDFVFPDGTEMQWESVNWLQKFHMKWFNKERTRTYLTFPVETVNLVYDPVTFEYRDQEWYDFTAEMWALGHSFFCYTSDTVDSLSSCCRLKNGITENTFSYTLGAGGIATGSKAVITMNVNRIVQDAVRNGIDYSEAIREQARLNQKYLIAYNELLKEELANGMLPIYSAGYISLDKQYLTQGINGLVEAAEFLGIEISPNEEYYDFCRRILEPIMEENKRARTEEGTYFTFSINSDKYRVPKNVILTVFDVKNNKEVDLPAYEVFNHVEEYSVDEKNILKFKI